MWWHVGKSWLMEASNEAMRWKTQMLLKEEVHFESSVVHSCFKQLLPILIANSIAILFGEHIAMIVSKWLNMNFNSYLSYVYQTFSIEII